MSSFIAEDMPLLRTPQALLRAAGLRAKKTWGQNFLCDQNVLRAIARATSAGPEQPVVELGAGLGALTYQLLNCGGQVIAIERDRELVPHLASYLESTGSRLQIREADAARLDYAALAQEFGPLSVSGNLPYQLSGRILVSLADARGAVRQAVLLVQREVADRLLASPPGREYGLLSVLVQRTFHVERVLDVPPRAFFPAPKVHSTVVRLRLRDALGGAEPHAGAAAGSDAESDAVLVRAARAAFSARRKTLRNAISGGCQVSGAEAEAVLVQAGISPQARAETLQLCDFSRLGQAFLQAGWLAPGPTDASEEVL